jgi:hypothetical protein
MGMRSDYEHEDPLESSTYRELRVLSEVDRNPQVSQRALSRQLGIALGLTNLVVRNLAQKGYVRVTQTSWKRWVYLVTPEGFTRKVNLMVGYIHRVLDHYRQVRETLREQLVPLALNEESRVAIYGTGEFAELVYLGLREHGIEEIDVFGPNGTDGHKFLGMPVREIATLQSEDYDRILVGLLGDWESASQALRERGASSYQLVTFFADGREREEVR